MNEYDENKHSDIDKHKSSVVSGEREEKRGKIGVGD